MLEHFEPPRVLARIKISLHFCMRNKVGRRVYDDVDGHKRVRERHPIRVEGSTAYLCAFIPEGRASMLACDSADNAKALSLLPHYTYILYTHIQPLCANIFSNIRKLPSFMLAPKIYMHGSFYGEGVEPIVDAPSFSLSILPSLYHLRLSLYFFFFIFFS